MEQNNVINMETRVRDFYDVITSRINLETDALLKTDMNAKAAPTYEDIRTIGKFILQLVKTRCEENPTFKPDAIFAAYLMSMQTILSGGILSPITGDESEWIEFPSENTTFNDIEINFRGNKVVIPVESVQINIRYPYIKRFNHDNRTAHVSNMIEFNDISSDGENTTFNTIDSLRYIQFPYEPRKINIDVYFDKENNRYDYDMICIPEGQTLTDAIIFEYENQPEKSPVLIIAPAVPFYVLDELGINIDDEIQEAISQIESYHDMLDSAIDNIIEDNNEEDVENIEDPTDVRKLKNTAEYRYIYDLVKVILEEDVDVKQKTTLKSESDAVNRILKTKYNIDLNEESIQMVLNDIHFSR